MQEQGELLRANRILIVAGVFAGGMGALAFGMQPSGGDPCPLVIEMIIRYGGNSNCDMYYECEEGEACINFGIGEFVDCGEPTLWPAMCYVYQNGTWDTEAEHCVGGEWVMTVEQSEEWFYLDPTGCGGGES